MMPRMRWSSSAFWGLRKGIVPYTANANQFPSTRITSALTSMRAISGHRRNCSKSYSKDSGMIPHLDVAVDRGRRAVGVAEGHLWAIRF